ncbi:hypothetical protein IWX64_001526 [Arthrobacter sp. CAN_A212]|uniref:hypothetical protein n=1 Tax=Arthrobacter sp. CAN_A212 TaxID=2787719 RepID=UPI0018C9B0C0
MRWQAAHLTFGARRLVRIRAEFGCYHWACEWEGFSLYYPRERETWQWAPDRTARLHRDNAKLRAQHDALVGLVADDNELYAEQIQEMLDKSIGNTFGAYELELKRTELPAETDPRSEERQKLKSPSRNLACLHPLAPCWRRSSPARSSARRF